MAEKEGDPVRPGQTVIVLLAPPGGGKGTQAGKLESEFGFQHLSTGDALRAEIRKESDLGKKLDAIMAAGDLVPDEVVGEIVRQRLKEGADVEGFVFDGYPRNVRQAEFLESITRSVPVYAINLEVSEEEVIRRIAGRRFCSECGKVYNVHFSSPSVPGACDECGGHLERRSDDREEVIEERLKIYREQTRPVIDFYSRRKNYYEIDGDRDVDTVYEDLCKIVGALVG